jgi:hypothetical protein
VKERKGEVAIKTKHVIERNPSKKYSENKK